MIRGIRKTGIDAGNIDFLILSHEHGDHTEGISGFARFKKGIIVIILFLKLTLVGSQFYFLN